MCLCSSTAFGQAKSGVENYNLMGGGEEYVWMPVFHYQAKNGFYTELRYNYEDVQTLSLFAGNTFTGGKSFEYTITPMAGFSTGKFTGVSLAANTDAEWKNFYFSSQTQYSFSTKKEVSNFFFSWSELGYSITKHLFAGLAMQYTRQNDFNDFEPGFVAGLEINNFSFPVYVFSPFRSGSYFVVGVNYQYHAKKKN